MYRMDPIVNVSDDVKLHDNQTEYMRTYFVPKRELRTSRILQATSKGKGKLTASLTYYGSTYETKEVLKITQVVVICEQVRFSLNNRSGLSRSIFLPWIPFVYQEALLKATSGCAKTSSDYKWFSSDMSVVTVFASGVVQAKEAGKATVKVQYGFDPSNYDERILSVHYSIPHYVRVSLDCKHLLSRIFVADPATRITIPEIKKHPWFLKNLPIEFTDEGSEALQDGENDTSQSIEEILSIIQEARNPADGLTVGGQFVGGSLDMDELDTDIDIDDLEASGDFVCALEC